MNEACIVVILIFAAIICLAMSFMRAVKIRFDGKEKGE